MSLLSEILSSGVRAEFFRLLFGFNSAEIHLREIQRLSGFAIGSVRQEASKLVRLGLILRRKDGNRVYFQASRNHPLYRDIHNITLKTSGVVDLLRAALGQLPVRFAFVFGSMASGAERPESDIDLFVVGQTGLRALVKALKQCPELTGREINPNIMTEKEFVKRRNEREHFVTSVLKLPKLMIVGTENELAGMGR
jgi:uncharacterized protein